MAVPKKPSDKDIPAKKYSEDDGDDDQDNIKPGKQPDDDDDFDEDIPLDDDLGRFDAFDPYEDDDED